MSSLRSAGAFCCTAADMTLGGCCRGVCQTNVSFASNALCLCVRILKGEQSRAAEICSRPGAATNEGRAGAMSNQPAAHHRMHCSLHILSPPPSPPGPCSLPLPLPLLLPNNRSLGLCTKLNSHGQKETAALTHTRRPQERRVQRIRTKADERMSFFACLTGWESAVPASATSRVASAASSASAAASKAAAAASTADNATAQEETTAWRFALAAALIFWVTTAIKLLCMPF
jgi:hypothetical protein